MPVAAVQASTTGPTQAIIIDLALFKNGVGILINIPLATSATVNVEVTGDNPGGGTYALTHWNTHDLLNTLSSSTNGNLAMPVSAVRLNVGSINPAGGPVTMAVIQAED